MSEHSFFPITNNRLHFLYELQKASHWDIDEIDFSEDYEQWCLIEKSPIHSGIIPILKHILCFFAQADGLINSNLVDNFMEDTRHVKEAKHFYSIQIGMETIHSQVYSMLIDIFITDPNEKQKMFEASLHFNSIKKIREWMEKWMNKSLPITRRIIAFSCIEGILFSAAFCVIYWIKKNIPGMLNGLTSSNEFIARDEGLHAIFASELYEHYITHLGHDNVSTKEFDSIISSSVELAEEFFNEAFEKGNVLELTKQDVMTYVKCTADTLLKSYDTPPLYDLQNPFEWMVLLGLNNKTNFFEKKVAEYKRGTSRVDTFVFTTSESY